MQTVFHHKVHMKNMLPVYMNNIACGMRWKTCLYFAGGEIEGQWGKQAWRFDFQLLSFADLPEMDLILEMPSLAACNGKPQVEGFFVAGRNQEGGNGVITFFSEVSQDWHPIYDENDELIVYDSQACGFPAMKQFVNRGMSSKSNYLLIIGGMTPTNPLTVTTQAKLFKIDI